TSSSRYGRAQPRTLEASAGACTSRARPSASVGKRPTSTRSVCSAPPSILIWVEAAWTLALSAWPNRRGPTNPMIRPMITSTTIISRRVKPPMRGGETGGRFMAGCAGSDREVVGAGDRQDHAENDGTYHATNYQDGDRLDQDQHLLHAVAPGFGIDAGKRFQHGRKLAGTLADPDQVVAGRGQRVVLLQGVGQRASTAHRPAHLAHPRLAVRQLQSRMRQ